MSIKLDNFKLPKTVEFTYCVYAVLWDFLDEPEAKIMNGNRKSNDHYETDSDYIFIEENTIEIPLKNSGEFDLRSGVLQSLEDEKITILARHHMELTNINGKIDQLLAIEHHEGN